MYKINTFKSLIFLFIFYLSSFNIFIWLCSSKWFMGFIVVLSLAKAVTVQSNIFTFCFKSVCNVVVHLIASWFGTSLTIFIFHKDF